MKTFGTLIAAWYHISVCDCHSCVIMKTFGTLIAAFIVGLVSLWISMSFFSPLFSSEKSGESAYSSLLSNDKQRHLMVGQAFAKTFSAKPGSAHGNRSGAIHGENIHGRGAAIVAILALSFFPGALIVTPFLLSSFLFGFTANKLSRYFIPYPVIAGGILWCLLLILLGVGVSQALVDVGNYLKQNNPDLYSAYAFAYSPYNESRKTIDNIINTGNISLMLSIFAVPAMMIFGSKVGKT